LKITEKLGNQNILLIDIETSPSLGWVWGRWEQNVLSFEKEWDLLCFGYKWLGEAVTVLSLPRFKNEKSFVQSVWKLMDRAEVVVAHNGDQFDIKKLNAKFIYYGMGPPSPYRTVDTLKVARRYFAFNGNKLGDLGPHLNLGAKLDHIGFKLWLGCLKGDKDSWDTMCRYNKQDVILLEKIYNLFLPWTNHPNMALGIDKPVCSRCKSKHIWSEGMKYRTNMASYRLFRCLDCKGYMRGTANLNEYKPLKSV
jgi:hypothetical protein